MNQFANNGERNRAERQIKRWLNGGGERTNQGGIERKATDDRNRNASEAVLDCGR